jgi:glycosyltransferase involved in cell wall biosynthesis
MGTLRIAYVHYGEQSGVTPRITGALEALGHELIPVDGFGPLAIRHPDRRPRMTPQVLTHLALAAARFGRSALYYRHCTPYAFAVHSRAIGAALARLPAPPDVVLQNGVLFAPGRPPPFPYVLLLDHTRALAERTARQVPSHLSSSPRWGDGWLAREGATYRGAAGVATFSANTARSVVQDYGADAGAVHVVGAGANAFPEQIRRDDDGQTILFIGRDFARKGGHVLLEAFRKLRRGRPNARLLIAGPPQRLALPGGAVQLGPVDYAALPGLLSRATVFTMPTLLEPFGIAFLDAMACGVPCVGTRVEAVPEIIDHGSTGLLVPPGDADALATALDRLLAAPALARRMGERGRARVRERFLWSVVARKLEAVLAHAAARRGRTTHDTAGAMAMATPA